MNSIEKAKKLSEAAKLKEKTKRDLEYKKKLLETSVKNKIGVERQALSVKYAAKRAEDAAKKYNSLV